VNSVFEGTGHAAPRDRAAGWLTDLRDWLIRSDARSLSLRFTVLSVFGLGLGSACAILPQSPFVESLHASRWLGLHALIMVFSVAIPIIPSSLGVLLLPKLTGTRWPALPRVCLASLLLYVASILVWMLAIAYRPDSVSWPPVDYEYGSSSLPDYLPSLGIVLSGLCSLLLAWSILVGMLKYLSGQKPRGWMPSLALGLMIWSVVQVIGVPVLLLSIILLVFERTMHAGVFDPSMGGDPVLHEHLFRFYTHPALLCSLLPAIGIIRTVLSGKDRALTTHGSFIHYSFIAFALSAVLSWGIHMTSGRQSEFASMIFSFFGLMVVVPLSYMVLSTSRMLIVRVTTPVTKMYILLLLLGAGFGIASSVALGVLPTGVFLRSTIFTSAHLHFLTLGCVVAAFVAGLQHWWTDLFHRRIPTWMAWMSFVLVSVGILTAFLPQFAAGLKGKVLSDLFVAKESTWDSVILTSGTLMIVLGFGVIAGSMMWSFLGKKRA